MKLRPWTGRVDCKKIRHIDLPLLLPTAMILLILRAGSLLSVGFEKVLLLQNPLQSGRKWNHFDLYATKWGWLIFNIVTRQRSVSLIPWLTWSSYCRSTGLRNAIPRQDCSRKEEKLKLFQHARKTKSEILFDIFIYGLAICLILLIVYPLWFVIIASFSNPSDVATGKVWFIPREWRLDGYQRLIEQPLFLKSYLNTILYTVVGTIVALVINIPAGYALSRKDLFAKNGSVSSLSFPCLSLGGLIPIYLTVKQMGLVDTFWVMVVPFAVSPYNIVVARTFFNNSIPEGMWEAAQIDGCGTIHYFRKIVLPLSKAIIAVIGLWTAVGIWNSWFNALIYLTNENLQPLQLILRRL